MPILLHQTVTISAYFYYSCSKYEIIASISLSPLPDKFTIIILSLSSVGASFLAYASA